MDKEYFKKFNEMIPTELKAKVKEIFNAIGQPPAVPATTPVAIQLQESKLKDGTVIKYDTPTLSPGATVTIVSLDGEKPATEGEWILEDGTTVKTGPDGKVTEIIPVAPVADAAPQLAQMRAEFESKLSAFADASSFAGLKSDHEAVKKELSEVKEQFKKFVEVFSSIIETPSADPIETPKNKFAEGVNRKANILQKFNTK